jgi:hypothetical protein
VEKGPENPVHRAVFEDVTDLPEPEREEVKSAAVPKVVKPVAVAVVEVLPTHATIQHFVAMQHHIMPCYM